MKWSRSELKGTGSVFRFSLVQQLKGKVNLITFLILFLLAAGSVPVMALRGGGKGVETSRVKTVYVENNTDFRLDVENEGESQTGQGEEGNPTGQGEEGNLTGQSEEGNPIGQSEEGNPTGQGEEGNPIGQSEEGNPTGQSAEKKRAGLGELNAAFRDTRLAVADFSLEEYESHLPEDAVLAVIAPVQAAGENAGTEDSGQAAGESAGAKEAGQAAETPVSGYAIDLYTVETSKLEEEDLEPLEQALSQMFDNARMEAAGASAGQLKRLETAVQTRVLSEEDYRNPEKNNWESQFALQYAYAIIIMMLCLLSSSYVVRAIAEEKSSKLVELLMVSVRPLALLLGKVLAMMVFILITLAVMVLGFGASWFVTGKFLDVSALNVAGLMGINMGSIHMGIGLGAAVVFSILLGYLTFSLVAGVAGCCCESMDDVEGANTKVVLMVMAGYLASCVASAFTSGPVCVISSLFPLVSVFCAPVQYALGNIGLGVLLLSWLLQIAVIAGLAVFSARVYNDLIIHRGSKVGFGQLLAMAGRKGGARR